MRDDAVESRSRQEPAVARVLEPRVLVPLAAVDRADRAEPGDVGGKVPGERAAREQPGAVRRQRAERERGIALGVEEPRVRGQVVARPAPVEVRVVSGVPRVRRRVVIGPHRDEGRPVGAHGVANMAAAEEDLRVRPGLEAHDGAAPVVEGRVVRVVINGPLQRPLRDRPRLGERSGHAARAQLRRLDRERIARGGALRHRGPRRGAERRARRRRPGEERLVVDRRALDVDARVERVLAAPLQSGRREPARKHGAVVGVQPGEGRVRRAAVAERALDAGAGVSRVVDDLEIDRQRRRAVRGLRLRRDGDQTPEATRRGEEAGRVDVADERETHGPRRHDGRGRSLQRGGEPRGRAWTRDRERRRRGRDEEHGLRRTARVERRSAPRVVALPRRAAVEGGSHRRGGGAGVVRRRGGPCVRASGRPEGDCDNHTRQDQRRPAHDAARARARGLEHLRPPKLGR